MTVRQVIGAIIAHKRNATTWAVYMESQLFPAIGMTAGTFAQPQSVPWSRMAPNVGSRGGPYWLNPDASGMIISCAADMHAYLQFVSAVAAPGVAPATGQQVLTPASAQRLRDSGLWPGLGMGLVQESWGPEPLAFAHGGSLWGFSTKIHFVPRTGMYLFIAVGQDPSTTRDVASCVLAARFAPGSVAPLPPTAPASVPPFSGAKYYLAQNVFYGPLSLSYVLGRMGGGATVVVPTSDAASSSIVMSFQGQSIPYAFVSPNLFEFPGPRNQSDPALCAFVSRPFVAVNSSDFFTLFEPYQGFMQAPLSKAPEVALGLLFGGLAGIGLAGLALFLSLLFRALCCKAERDEREVPLLDKHDRAGGGAAHSEQSRARRGLGNVLSVSMFVLVVLCWVFAAVFFPLYNSAMATIDTAATANGFSWQFAKACPYVLLGLFFVIAGVLFALVLLSPKAWRRAKERYVIMLVFLAALAVLLMGFAVVDLLFY